MTSSENGVSGLTEDKTDQRETYSNHSGQQTNRNKKNGTNVINLIDSKFYSNLNYLVGYSRLASE